MGFVQCNEFTSILDILNEGAVEDPCAMAQAGLHLIWYMCRTEH